MKFLSIAVLALAGVVAAAPEMEKRAQLEKRVSIFTQ
jgi:hypothetical protein